MKVAINQPYFFPYLGYFKLIQECDVFVVFNDVQYIRRGWINRNRIRCNNKEFQYLTVPIDKSCRTTIIKDIKINYDNDWHNLHKNQLLSSYGKKSKCILDIYDTMPPSEFLVDILIFTLEKMCNVLGIKRQFVLSSEIPYVSQGTTGPSDRLLSICKHLNANEYLNLSGGQKLYNSETFLRHNVKLRFISTEHPNQLSIIDYVLTEENINDSIR